MSRNSISLMLYRTRYSTILSAQRKDFVFARSFSSCRPSWTGYEPPVTGSTTKDGVDYPSDAWTNVPSGILEKTSRQLHLNPAHPIGIIRNLIEAHFSTYQPVHPPSAVVSTSKNFDDLGFPADHPGRSKSDTYYLNSTTLLRTHTSAHEVETFRSGLNQWLLSADVYRRDEIDASHYPVFHQMEGASVFDHQTIHALPAINQELSDQILSSASPLIVTDPTHPLPPHNYYQPEHEDLTGTVDLLINSLKLSLNSLILSLFRSHTDSAGEPLQVRWIEATFPFTSPSYEVEVLWNGEWLEILGCGIVAQKTLTTAGVPDKIGFAFGLGLERLAMILFSIPDIRLFWSEDPRFLEQFKPGEITTFKPYSKYPPMYRDMSFWIQDGVKWEENDLCDLVRQVGGDLVENVKKFDEFLHPKTGRVSLAYRITYRSMDKTLTDEEVSTIQTELSHRAVEALKIEMR